MEWKTTTENLSHLQGINSGGKKRVWFWLLEMGGGGGGRSNSQMIQLLLKNYGKKKKKKEGAGRVRNLIIIISLLWGSVKICQTHLCLVAPEV